MKKDPALFERNDCRFLFFLHRCFSIRERRLAIPRKRIQTVVERLKVPNETGLYWYGPPFPICSDYYEV
jgi:hypothetical protein